MGLDTAGHPVVLPTSSFLVQVKFQKETSLPVSAGCRDFTTFSKQAGFVFSSGLIMVVIWIGIWIQELLKEF